MSSANVHVFNHLVNYFLTLFGGKQAKLITHELIVFLVIKFEIVLLEVLDSNIPRK